MTREQSYGISVVVGAALLLLGSVVPWRHGDWGVPAGVYLIVWANNLISKDKP